MSESIGTVVSVGWETSTPTTGYVSFGTTPSLEQAVPLEENAATVHRQTLLGLAADTTYYYRVLTWDVPNVTAGASDVRTFHTGALPSDAPSVVAESFPVLGDDGKPEDGMQDFVIVPFAGATATTVGIVDLNGTLIWFHTDDSHRSVTRARLSSDKASVLYNAIGSGADADSSEIVSVPLDGSATSTVSVPELGQDFAVLKDDTLAVLLPDERTSHGSDFVGDSIVEVARDGTRRTVWSSWDCFDPQTSPGDGANGVWTGASALQVDSKHDAYYVALRNLSSVVKVDRDTGKCVWILGDAAEATLAYGKGNVPFAHPGSFYADETELIVLDADGKGSGSRTVSYALDLTASTATQNQSYEPSIRQHVTALGEVTVVLGGDTLVNWANGSRIELVDELGQVKWALSATSGETLGYQTAFRDLYQRTVEGNQ